MTEVDSKLKETCINVAEIVRDHALDVVPKRTRMLASSITTGELPEGAYVAAQTEYAKTVHEGEPLPGAHEIRPRRKKALKFTLKDGREVFAKRVNHPGAKKFKTTPFFRIALERGSGEIKALVKKRMGEAAADDFGQYLKGIGFEVERL